MTNKKIMLIDESAFELTQNGIRDNEADAWFIAFLRDARSEFEIIVVTNNSPQTLKTKLKNIDFSEAFVEDKKVDQSFLTQDIRHWDNIDFDHIDVVMTHEDLPAHCDDPDLIICSGSTNGPNSFYYWIESYEENIMFEGGFRVMNKITESLEAHEKETEEILTKLFGDAEALWKKIKSAPNVKKLVDVFSAVSEEIPGFKSAEDRVLDCLHGYFAYVVRQQYAPDTTKDIDGNLQVYKEGLLHSFIESNIGGNYQAKQEIPISLFRENRDEYETKSSKAMHEWRNQPILEEHTSLVEDALKTIHQIVADELIIETYH